MKIAIIGGGRLADVVLKMLGASTTPMSLHHFARQEDVRKSFAKKHKKLVSAASLQEAAKDARVVLLAVPATALEEVSAVYGEVARPEQVVLHACRGATAGFRLPHQLIRGTTCVRKIVTLAGPLHGRDLGSGRVMAAAVASRFSAAIDAVRQMTAGTPIRLHPTSDLLGVEVVSAMSNVWALAVGMADALELGETARGLLLMRGLVEAQRIGISLGADPATFAGLAGLGDLVPRKVTSTEKHHEAGAQLVRAAAPGDEAPKTAKDGPTFAQLEGPSTLAAAIELSRARRLDTPLLLAIGRAAAEPQGARAALEGVLALDLPTLLIPSAAR